jgi:CheY-like chemotaxis protein
MELEGNENERLARLSHQLRTPLGTVLGAAELLASSALSPNQRRHVEMLKRAAAELVILLDTLATHDSLESGGTGGLCNPRPAASPALPRTLEGLRLLVVDDSEDARAIIAEFLFGTGIALSFAETSAAALTLLEHARFHLAIVDLDLPDVGGIDTILALRRSEHERGVDPVPVIVLTGETRATVARRALDAGCAALLTKPISREALLAAIAAHRRPAGPSRALRESFLSNRVREVVMAREALERGDLPWLQTLGHKLRGNGTSYGFPRLSALGGLIEDAARARDQGRLRELLAGLGSVCQESS